MLLFYISPVAFILQNSHGPFSVLKHSCSAAFCTLPPPSSLKCLVCWLLWPHYFPPKPWDFFLSLFCWFFFPCSAFTSKCCSTLGLGPRTPFSPIYILSIYNCITKFIWFLKQNLWVILFFSPSLHLIHQQVLATILYNIFLLQPLLVILRIQLDSVQD